MNYALIALTNERNLLTKMKMLAFIKENLETESLGS